MKVALGPILIIPECYFSVYPCRKARKCTLGRDDHMHRKWKELAEKYTDSATYRKDWQRSHKAMSELCEYINSSHMNDALFGHTSMHSLFISQIPVSYPPHPSTPWLRIEPLDDSKVEFRYVDTRIDERQWNRVVDAEKVIDRFKRFITQLDWSVPELP
jgi:hypothetical protein